tara:strand:- start:2987 stop:3649 length:663 start_codon:yes stop_codon:yes gene_type:complete
MAKGRIQDAIKEVAIPIEERRFTNVHNRMKGIKGLKRKERDLIASIDPDILGEVLKALNPLFKEEIEENIDADLMLPRGEQKILQAVSDKVDRGLRVKLLEDGGYDVAYWFKDPSKPYPVEVLVDGESVKKDAKIVELKFHPEIPEDIDERAAVVMDIRNIVATMLKDIQTKLEKELKKGQTETANNVGRLVGLKVTTKGQKKNKAFMYDVTKGHRGSFK